MGYLAVWKVLEEMTTNLRKKGTLIPAQIMTELKNAKTLISILKADPKCTDTIQNIENSMQKIEAYLVLEGQNRFGKEYAEKWLKKLNDAAKKIFEGGEENETRFVVGAPRDEKWIRVKPSNNLPIEKLKALADRSNLSYKLQNDGALLVYGKNEHLKEFVKKMTSEAR